MGESEESQDTVCVPLLFYSIPIHVSSVRIAGPGVSAKFFRNSWESSPTSLNVS